jgi:glycerol uptake facilitator-like aquaporin
MSHSLLRRCLAELFGTAILVGIGTGAIVAASRYGGVPQWVLAVAWFLAVAVPVVALAAVSGAHLNPAVTLALLIRGRFPRGEILPYVAAQVAGAFLGSLLVLGTLGGGAHLGATLPRGGDVWLVFPLEAAFTAALVLSVLYLTRPNPRDRWIELLLPAAVVGVATFVIGPWTGSSLNPARSLAPALLSGDLLDLWAYLLAVPAGAILAAALARTLDRRDGAGLAAARTTGPAP